LLIYKDLFPLAKKKKKHVLQRQRQCNNHELRLFNQQLLLLDHIFPQDKKKGWKLRHELGVNAKISTQGIAACYLHALLLQINEEESSRCARMHRT